jgi:thioredoxin 1
MKSLIIAAIFSHTIIGLSFFSPAQEKSGNAGIVFFNGSFKEALTKAKKENKYLFLDAYASWCVPCKTMEAEVYSDSTVGKYFNEKFVAIKIDMEKGEGPQLAKRLTSIDGYPSLLFFDSQGHLNKTILGSRKAIDFLNEAKLVAK